MDTGAPELGTEPAVLSGQDGPPTSMADQGTASGDVAPAAYMFAVHSRARKWSTGFPSALRRIAAKADLPMPSFPASMSRPVRRGISYSRELVGNAHGLLPALGQPHLRPLLAHARRLRSAPLFPQLGHQVPEGCHVRRDDLQLHPPVAGGPPRFQEAARSGHQAAHRAAGIVNGGQETVLLLRCHVDAASGTGLVQDLDDGRAPILTRLRPPDGPVATHRSTLNDRPVDAGRCRRCCPGSL